MATLVIKNLPSDLHARLRSRAERNHRSVTKEVIALIDAGVADRHPEPAATPFPRSMSGDELDAALRDQRYVHYRSIDELNRHVDTLRAERDSSSA